MLLARLYAAEVVANEVFVALGDVVAFEGVARLLFVLAVHLVIRHLRRASAVGVGVGSRAALLAAGVILPLHDDLRGGSVDIRRGCVHGVGVAAACLAAGPILSLLALALL